MKMRHKVIEIRNMHTAIHELYIVNSKPKTTMRYFNALEDGDHVESDEYLWDLVNDNTEYLGEVNFREKKYSSKYGNYYEFDGDIYEIMNSSPYDIY